MRCYICHKEFSGEKHPNYQRMCQKCGSINSIKREELANLNGYNALVTGGRIKIGYETALKLLRSGAFVIITTRFPVDAVKRYSQESDFSDWHERLRIFQIDFRQLQNLYDLICYIEDECVYLDILINNAAQTVRHSYSYYQQLYEGEERLYKSLSKSQKALIVFSKRKKFVDIQQSMDALLPIPPLSLNENSCPLDKKILNNKESLEKNKNPGHIRNSWTSKACDISIVEMLEVQLINVTSPFFLCSGTRKLMKHSPHGYKFIINVSAMEGQFHKKNKNCYHPHTNMAKASLNMLTRTSAQEFALDGILMNSVDTGWITDENPEWLRERNERKGLIPPLDSKDGASRLCDPIFSSINKGNHIYGAFLKDYKRTEW